MKKIRIGTDIEIRWPILTNGEPVALNGRDLKLVLHTPIHQKSDLKFTVSDNELTAIYTGTEQRIIGVYNLTLWENYGKQRQTVIDKCEAFELVPWSCIDGKADNNLVVRPVIQLEASDMIVGLPGYSAYELALKNGFVGSEKEWLASLVGPKGDAFTYSDFTPEQIKELQKPASDMITQLQDTEKAVEKNELNRQTAEQQREEHETQRSSTFNELSQNLSTAISNANSASQKVTEAVANIPVTLKTIKSTNEVNI